MTYVKISLLSTLVLCMVEWSLPYLIPGTWYTQSGYVRDGGVIFRAASLEELDIFLPKTDFEKVR